LSARCEKFTPRRDAGFAEAEKLEGIERAKALAGALKALEGGFPDSTEELASDPMKRFYHDEIATVIRRSMPDTRRWVARPFRRPATQS